MFYIITKCKIMIRIKTKTKKNREVFKEYTHLYIFYLVFE